MTQITVVLLSILSLNLNAQINFEINLEKDTVSSYTYSIQKKNTGEYILTGAVYTPENFIGNSIFKLNENREITFFSIKLPEDTLYINEDIKLLPNGNYLVYSILHAHNDCKKTKIRFTEYDSLFNVVWQKTYSSPIDLLIVRQSKVFLHNNGMYCRQYSTSFL